MYLLRNSNFNFSYVLHVIRSFLVCILDTRLIKERNINTIIEIQNSLFSVKAGASLLGRAHTKRYIARC